MDAPGGAIAGVEEADVAGAELEGRAVLDLDRRPAAQDDEERIGLGVAGDARGVLPDAALDPAVGRGVQDPKPARPP